MEDLIIILVIAAVLGLAIRFIYKQKKRGARCVGCSSGGCTGTCNCSKEK